MKVERGLPMKNSRKQGFKSLLKHLGGTAKNFDVS